METTEKLLVALKQYRNRQERLEHPEGKFDKSQRWYPSESEEQQCCKSIRNPSRSYPFSLMKHCRSVEHVAMLNGVNASDLRKAYRKSCPPDPPTREGGEYYKAVAVVDGKFFSVYNGRTEYVIGREMYEPARQDHKGGYYVQRTIHGAEHAIFPSDAVFKNHPRAILKLKCEGNYCKYDNGKIAFSRITPIERVK